MDKISDLKELVISTLDLNKAQNIVTIDLKDKSSMADYMIIASGTSSRHIQSLSEQVLEKLKNNGVKDRDENIELLFNSNVSLCSHISLGKRILTCSKLFKTTWSLAKFLTNGKNG